jgi:endoglucanase
MRPESLDLIKALVSAPSPSGYEQPAAKVYREYTQEFADQVTLDIHGNTTSVLHPDAAMRIMLAAHTDEIGFVIHYIGEDGFLYFSPVGGHDEVVPVGQRVWVHGKERIPGVVGSSAFHLLTPDERKKRPEIKSLWIDIGATSRADAERLVQLGDPVTYQQEFQSLLGERASARAFDNKAGVFVVAEALRLLRQEGGLHESVGVHAVATVQEEIGSRGARTAAFRIDAQTGLAIDMDHAIDYPGVSRPHHGQLEIGKGRACRAAPTSTMRFSIW